MGFVPREDRRSASPDLLGIAALDLATLAGVMMNQRKITAILRARAGKEAQLESLLRQLAVASRLEAGNLRWDIWQDQADAGTFVLDELYADDAAVLAHRATPHF